MIMIRPYQLRSLRHQETDQHYRQTEPPNKPTWDNENNVKFLLRSRNQKKLKKPFSETLF